MDSVQKVTTDHLVTLLIPVYHASATTRHKPVTQELVSASTVLKTQQENTVNCVYQVTLVTQLSVSNASSASVHFWTRVSVPHAS